MPLLGAQCIINLSLSTKDQNRLNYIHELPYGTGLPRISGIEDCKCVLIQYNEYNCQLFHPINALDHVFCPADLYKHYFSMKTDTISQFGKNENSTHFPFMIL